MSLGQYKRNVDGTWQGTTCKGIVRKVNEDPVDNAALDLEIAISAGESAEEIGRLCSVLHCTSEVQYLVEPKNYSDL
jgi:hypothetical protein